MQEDNKILKLVNSDILIGKCSKGDNDQIVVENPYTVKDLGKGPCVMPYELDLLIDPMKYIAFPGFNMLWLKNLKDFPTVEEQYISATSGIDIN